MTTTIDISKVSSKDMLKELSSRLPLGSLLTVLELKKYENGQSRVLVKCACGVEKLILTSNLRRTKSCGCFKAKLIGDRFRTHGRSQTREYQMWASIKDRCFNPRYREFHLYGGRGIVMCDRWASSFENFLADMGERPAGMSIDRIDSNGNYEPGNCRWASDAGQAHNVRTNKLTMEKAREIRRLRAQGVTYKELAARFGVSEGSIGYVLNGSQWREGDERYVPAACNSDRA